MKEIYLARVRKTSEGLAFHDQSGAQIGIALFDKPESYARTYKSIQDAVTANMLTPSKGAQFCNTLEREVGYAPKESSFASHEREMRLYLPLTRRAA